MKFALQIIFFYSPLVLAGFFNSIFIKSSFLNSLKAPLDNGKVLSDGKRLFGKNKTWKGFIGMPFFTSLWMIIFWCYYNFSSWFKDYSVIPYEQFSILLMGVYGFLWGLAYVVFELPNSFLKRRLNIGEGKEREGEGNTLFNFIDQADSAVGVLLLMPLFYDPPLSIAIIYFFASIAIHYFIHYFLLFVGLKKQS